MRAWPCIPRGSFGASALAVGVLLLLTGCSRSLETAAMFEFAGEELRVPMQVQNGVPKVQVRLNGKGPYSFLLDSGCSTITASARVIREAALPGLGGPLTFTNLAGASVSTPSHGLGLMELGMARLRNVAVRRVDSADYDGILGLCYFANYRVRMDFPRETLTVRRRGAAEAGAVSGLAMEMKDGLPHVTVKVGNRSLLFVIDSGCTGELMVPESTATNLPCCRERYSQLFRPEGSEGYCIVGRTRLRENVQVGPQTLVRPYVDWTAGFPGYHPGPGTEVLRHFAVEFDFPAGRVHFLREGTDPIHSPNRRQMPVCLRSWTDGMFVTHLYARPAWRSGDGWVVPCDDPRHDHGLGVRPGDRVVAIEGRTGTNLSCGDIETLRQQQDLLRFVVRRNGVVLTNHVPVWEDSFTF